MGITKDLLKRELEALEAQTKNVEAKANMLVGDHFGRIDVIKNQIAYLEQEEKASAAAKPTATLDHEDHLAPALRKTDG